jgi:hypothetical protein
MSQTTHQPSGPFYIGIDFHKHFSVFSVIDDIDDIDDIEQAKTRVGKAIELDAKFKLLALDDADLEPL